MGNTGPPPEGPAPTNPEDERLKDRLAAWQSAGVIDAAIAARIEAFEAGRPVTDRPSRISVSEVIAYIGTVVLLVGVAFLYGTQYANLGSAGRLVIIGLVVAAGLAAGELVKRVGATGAARRARAAGWTVAAVAAAIWFSQAFIDANVLTQASRYGYPDESDTSGSIMLGAAIGSVIAAVLLWRAGAALLAIVTAALAYTTAGQFDNYARTLPGTVSLVTWLVPAAILAVLSETVTRGHERRWAREVLRFAVVISPTIAALAISFNSGGDLEYFAAGFVLAGFGLALARSSGGYAIGSGVALFIVVNEVGFRHFAQSLGFPVVLIVSGITLFAVAGGLVRLLPRLRRPRVIAASQDERR